MGNTVNKHIRVDENHWRWIENAVRERGLSPTRLLISSALQAIDGRNWPRTEAEIRVARAPLFAAQAIARDLIAAGRENELEEIREFISTIVPDPDTGSPPQGLRDDQTGGDMTGDRPDEKARP